MMNHQTYNKVTPSFYPNQMHLRSVLTVDQVADLLRRMNLKLSKKEIKSGLKNAGIHPNDLVPMDALDRFYKNLKFRPEINDIFSSLTKEKRDYLLFEEFKVFLYDFQKMTSLPITRCYDIYMKYSMPLTEDSMNNNKIINSKFNNLGFIDRMMNIDHFTMFLMSSTNSIMSKSNKKVFQDMTRPLTDYFIMSSHNTYLIKDQLTGSSSVDGYIRAFLLGCKSVELDCYDGPNNEPIVYHGRTLVSRILFRDVIETVLKYAFAISYYPVTLSLECHCSIEQQEVMAQILKLTLGEYLLTEPISNISGRMPSPEDLKYKILIKGKVYNNELNKSFYNNSIPPSSSSTSSVPNSISSYSSSNIDYRLRNSIPNNDIDLKQSIIPTSSNIPVVEPLLESNGINRLALNSTPPTSILPLNKFTNLPYSNSPTSVSSTYLDSDSDFDNYSSSTSCSTSSYSDNNNNNNINNNHRRYSQKSISSNNSVNSNENSNNNSPVSNKGPLKRAINSMLRTPSTFLSSNSSLSKSIINNENVNENQDPALDFNTEILSEDNIDTSNLLNNMSNLQIGNNNNNVSGPMTKLKAAVSLASLIIYMKGIHFENFLESQKRFCFNNISSLSEKKSINLRKQNLLDFINHNSLFMTRVYPARYRITSKNYNPVPHWNSGCQMVAMNFQTYDKGMQLNLAMFSRNGNCGYYLKPKHLRREYNNGKITLNSQILKPKKLIIKLISGQQLPKKIKNNDNVVDPYVVLDLIDSNFNTANSSISHNTSNNNNNNNYSIPSSPTSSINSLLMINNNDEFMDNNNNNNNNESNLSKRYKSKSIQNNGFNPYWNQNFEFIIESIETSFIQFHVFDKDITKDSLIGTYTISVSSIEQGYRHIPLFNVNGNLLKFSTLFLHITIQ